MVSTTTNQSDYDRRRALEISLEIKERTRRDYLDTAEQLENKAAQFRSIAHQIDMGIMRTRLAIRRLEKK